MATVRLAKMDAIAFLSTLAAESAQLICTDPPYSSLEKYRNIGTTTRLKHSKGSSNDWFPVVSNEYFAPFFVEAYRVAARNSHMYVYTDFESMFHIRPAAEAAGWHTWKALVWDKMKIGMGYHYRARVEYILFFEKGKRKLENPGMPDMFDLKEDPEGYVIECNRIRNGYPTEKPVTVSEKLILQSTSRGELVCDPFMGSGSVGVAAVKCGCSFVGCDIQESAVAMAQGRLIAAGDIMNRVQLELRIVTRS
jgi:site-specific DNA-methyltransferase (adenine-specific)